jgi:phage shock protein A
MSGLSDTSAFETFDRMTAKVDQLEAQATAAAEISQDLSGDALEQRFKALEGSTDVDDELKALKAKVQKQLPG